MLKNYIYIFCFVLGSLSSQLIAQEIKIFKVNDFDLKGNVKSCLVSTKYGKEEYDFNAKGFLIKSVTRYNDSDYAMSYYKYSKGFLVEKRLENFHDNRIDSNTSLANIYTIDSVKNLKITEKIVTYNKEVLEQYEYYYNAEKKLVKVIRMNNNGTDETTVSYTVLKGEKTKTYRLNDVVLKSIRTSIKKGKDKAIQKIILTKKFIEGNPNMATEAIYDTASQLITENKFFFDANENQFTRSTVNTFVYDDNQMLSKKKTEENNTTFEEEYIYQFDDGDTGNWVKKIITPENSYTTRKIEYYQVEESAIESEE